MAQYKLAIVLGAGASRELGFPTGPELLKKISKNIEYKDTYSLGNYEYKDSEFFYSYRDIFNLTSENLWQNKLTETTSLLSRIISGGATSIDNIIFRNRKNKDLVNLAKYAVYYNISKCEATSTIAKSSNQRTQGIATICSKGEYLCRVCNSIFDGVTFDKIGEQISKIIVISFNYDRAFEYYFPHYVSLHYDIDIAKAAEICSKLLVHYPFGRIGPISPLEQQMQYGGDFRYKARTRSQGIKTIGDIAGPISLDIAGVNSVLALGLAYHDENMKILEEIFAKAQIFHFFGTAYNLSQPNIDAAKRRINGWGYGLSSGQLVLENRLAKDFVADISSALKYATQSP